MPSLLQSTLNTRPLPTGDGCFIRSDCLEKESRFTYYHLPVTGGGDTPKAPEETASFYLQMLDKQMDMIVQRIMDAKSNVLFSEEQEKTEQVLYRQLS